MPLTLDESNNQFLIKSYNENNIAINDKTYSTPVIISHNSQPIPWKISDFKTIKTGNLQPLVNNKPDIVIIGTGSQSLFPTPEQIFFFNKLSIGLEVMTTSAACRTFNVLLSENRKVVAGIIIS